MGKPYFIVTEGKGLDEFVAYLTAIEDATELSPKMPADQSKWADGATYDAPHGTVTVWSDGKWEAILAVDSIIRTIKRQVPATKVRFGAFNL